MKLKEKQKHFCREYIIDLNAAQAAIRAGYTKKSSRSTSSLLLTNPNIQAFIKELQTPKVEDLGITAEYVLRGIKGIAENAVKDSDRNKAFEMLSKYIGLFAEDNAQSISEPVTVINKVYVDA